MIKVKISSKEQINEEIKYSADLQNQITDYIDNFRSKKDNKNIRLFKLKLKDILYINKTISKGLPFYSAFNIKNTSLKQISNAYDKSSNTFNNDYINELINQYVTIRVRMVDVPQDAYPKEKIFAILGSYEKNDEQHFYIKIFYKNINTQKDAAETVIHELQHITQHINNLCLHYSSDLKNFNDPLKVQPILTPMKTDTLFGKASSSIKYSEQELANISSNAKKYLVFSPKEYKVWMTELINSYTSWLIDNDHLNKKTLINAKNKEKFNNSSLKDRLQYIKTAEKKYNISKANFLNSINKKPSYLSIATELVKTLFSDEKIKKDFCNSLLKSRTMENFININKSKSRFVNEFINGLTKKLKEQDV